MDQDQQSQIAALEAENDELYAALGKESPRQKAEREAREAAERHQQELADEEVSALPEFRELLEKQGLTREFEALDRLDELIRVHWADLAQLRRERHAARERIAHFTATSGGSLPTSWEQTKQEWLAKQQQSPGVSGGKAYRRQRVAKLVESLVGRYR